MSDERLLEEEFNEMCAMWDGSEQWVLLRSEHELSSLTVRFEAGSPTLQEIARMRQWVPKYQHMTSREAKLRLAGRERLAFERMGRHEAEERAARGRALGLNVEEQHRTEISYLPFCLTDGGICLIENDELADRVIAAMLAAGVPVFDEMPEFDADDGG